MIKLLILAAILAAGFLLTHRVIPFVCVRLGRLAGYRMRMTPMMAKRIQRFKTIKRGYYSFLLITTLFVVSLFLELIVNDKALLISYEGTWSSPAVCEWVSGLPFVDRTDFRSRLDYGLDGKGPVHYRKFRSYTRDPELILVATRQELDKVRRQAAGITRPVEPKPFSRVKPVKPQADASEEAQEAYEDALDEYTEEQEDHLDAQADYTDALEDYQFQTADVRTVEQTFRRLEVIRDNFRGGKARILMPLYPFSATERLLDLPGTPPHPPQLANGHYLGVTDNGADVLAQLCYGFRLAILFALICASVGYTTGVLVGGVMGYYGGWIDIGIQRFIEIWGSIPFLFTMMILGSIIKPDIVVLATILIILRSWLGITYTIRGEFYREKAKDYVSAATAMGVSDWKIITRHILPNSLVPVVTFAPFGIVSYIGVLVSLDFLGFGLPPGTPSWGYLLQQGNEHIVNEAYRFLIFVPSIAFAATLFCVVMIGEAVREGFDPKVFSRLR